MLQTTKLSKKLPLSIDVAECDKVGIVGGGSNCEDKTVKRSLFKNLNRATDYLTLKARLAFIKLRKAFTKAPIFQHFDLECHIWIETDASGYAIGGVLSQITLDNLGQWHPVAYYYWKMISAKTWYITYNGELLAIVEAIKTWQHYLEGCKHKMLVLTDYNNLCCFIKTKSLSFCQVW